MRTRPRTGGVALAAALTAAVAVWATQEPPAADQLLVRYLQHSGWLMQTGRHLLIFDYVGSFPDVPPLPDGVAPDPREFGDRRVLVFVTHSHSDHYSPEVFEWARQRPDIQYVLGWPVEARGVKARTMRPHEDASFDGLRVRTTASTDEGVGFLVTVNGLSIYHAGDHALWSDDLARAFKAEIRWLQALNVPIDLAFFPIATGRTCEPRPSLWKGVQAAAQQLHPRVLVPMHVRCPAELALYERFRAEVGPHLTGTRVVAPSARGQWFRYEAGALVPAAL
ncbi:MAG TPA: MBL fold metallo-hydrolase [Vicinamibacteria bacterium]